MLIVVTLVLSFFPLIMLENDRASAYQNPLENGAELVYSFHTLNNYNSFSSKQSYLSQYGTILFIAENNSIEVKLNIQAPPPETSTSYNDNYWYNATITSSSSLYSGFVSEFSRNAGTMVNIDGSEAINQGPVSYTFSQNYRGADQNIKEMTTLMGHTVPSAASIITGISNKSLSYPVNNFVTYDYVGAYNVILTLQVSGDIPFLNQLFDNSIGGSNSTLNSVIDFQMELAVTNLALQPIAYFHYFTEYIVFSIVLWVIALPTVLLSARRAKMRNVKSVDQTQGRQR
ncbi:hypothetical protein Thermo_01109 [Thermoplasmatales archaeon]|nr:hypothetical protein Thermo_01109 [Thermoplasmatales archaeon]